VSKWPSHCSNFGFWLFKISKEKEKNLPFQSFENFGDEKTCPVLVFLNFRDDGSLLG
jgi:hypothetical protein